MPANGDVVEFRTVVRGGNGSNQINVRHYWVNGVSGAGLSDQACLDQYSPLYAAQIKPLIPTTTSYSGCFFRRVLPTVGVQLSTLVGAGAGTRVGNALSNQVSGLITLRAALAPPRTRGRLYFPAPVTSDAGVVTGDPTAGYVAAMQAMGNALYGADITLGSGGNTISLRPVIYRRKSPPTYFQITSVVARSYFGTQRRRSTVHGADRVLL